MKRTLFITISLAVAVSTSAKWLPEKPAESDGIRVLDCTYNREKLVSAVPAGESGRWTVTVSADSVVIGAPGVRERKAQFIGFTETAIALCTSLVALYETTGEKQYLEQGPDLANLCATWTVSWDYILPPSTPLARLGANLTGAVWASTQNKHGAPGFCTLSGDALFKIYRATGDRRYAELLRDIIHAHAEGIQPDGRISERLTYCDADHRGSRADGWLTGWNETNGALMAIEIPGIYADTATGEVYTFDAVETAVTRHDDKGMQLAVTNPTAYPATVTILADTPTGETRRALTVNPGKTVKCKI